ncbi:MAG: UDP-N-acetylmuramoyl-tripeptide--D-alanyl-D-alanine ligase [Desulfurobacteriaceae bacterium]
MDAKELAKIVNGRLKGSGFVKSFEFDSREVKEGSLFVPIKGKRDGHLFIDDAFSKGAVGAFSEKKFFKIPEGKFIVEVENTFSAFLNLGKWKRGNFSGKTIAITGSVGKTTTKELINFVFEKFFTTYRNKKSFNNVLGIAYTLSNLPLNAKVYIQEIGTNKKGEVAELTSFVKPEISVITTVEKAHMEGFKSFNELLDEKFSITENTSLAIVPEKLKSFSKSNEVITFGRDGDVKLKKVFFKPDSTEFEIEAFGENFLIFSQVPGFGIVNATLILLGLSFIFDLPRNEVVDLVKHFSPPEKRLNVEKLNGIVLIDDSYNANPKSMENAIRVLSLQPYPKVAVIGEMLELGKESKVEHKNLGRLLNRFKIDVGVFYGEETKHAFREFEGNKFYFTRKEELIKFVNKYDFHGKVVLVKGSRGNRLEEVCEILRKRYKD